MSIGLNIRKLRSERKITQEELSEGLMNRVVLNRIEVGKSEPSVKQLLCIAEKLGTDINTLTEPAQDSELKQLWLDSNSKLASLYKTAKYAEIIDLFTSDKKDDDFSNNILEMFFVGMSYVNIDDNVKGLTTLMTFCMLFEKLPAKLKPTYVIEYAIAKNNISRILFFAKNLDEVEEHLLQAKFQLVKCEKVNHELFLSINQNLINYYNFSKQPEKSLKIIKTLLNPKILVIHKKLTAFMHQSASVTYYDLGNFEEAHFHLNSAMLLYTYSGNINQAGLCAINRFNLFREKNQLDEAVQFIEMAKKQFSEGSQVFHVLSLQIPMVYLGTEEFDKAEAYLDMVNYTKLRQADRDTYAFMKGILHFENGEYSKALKKFESCESQFEFNKYFYDLKLMNIIRYKISNDAVFLDKNEEYLYSQTTKNVYLREPL